MSDKIVRKLSDTKGNFSSYAVFCPACGCSHGFDSRWSFNGDLDKPTFKPSMLVRGTQPLTDDQYERVMKGEEVKTKPLVCHSFVTDGKIKYLGDCTHNLANKTVELEPF